jgi:hypothetical protein
MAEPEGFPNATGKRPASDSSSKLFTTPAGGKRSRLGEETPSRLRAPNVLHWTENWIADPVAPMSPEVLRHTKEFFDMCKQEDPDAKVPMKVAGAHPEILMALKEIKLRFGKPRSPKPGQRPGNVKQPGPTFETFARARPEIAVLTNEESARTEMIQVEPIGTCVNRFHKAFVEKIKSVIKRQPRGTFVMTDQVLDIVRSELADEHAYLEYPQLFLGVRGRFCHFLVCNDESFELVFRRDDSSCSAVKLRG